MIQLQKNVAILSTKTATYQQSTLNLKRQDNRIILKSFHSAWSIIGFNKAK